jgi:hypothetical protein
VGIYSHNIAIINKQFNYFGTLSQKDTFDSVKLFPLMFVNKFYIDIGDAYTRVLIYEIKITFENFPQI